MPLNLRRAFLHPAFELARVILQLAIEPGVFEGGGGVRGKERQPSCVGGAEAPRVLGIHVEKAQHLAPHQHGRADVGTHPGGLVLRRGVPQRACTRIGNHQRLAGADHPPQGRCVENGQGDLLRDAWGGQLLVATGTHGVGKIALDQHDVAGIAGDNPFDLLEDAVEDFAEIQRRGDGRSGLRQRFCQLPLFALGLEELAVGDRDGGLRRESFRQAGVFLRVEARFVFVEGNHADGFVADEKRRAQPGMNVGLHVGFFQKLTVTGRGVPDDEGRAPVHDLTVGIDVGGQVEGKSQQLLQVGEPMSADDFQVLPLK